MLMHRRATHRCDAQIAQAPGPSSSGHVRSRKGKGNSGTTTYVRVLSLKAKGSVDDGIYTCQISTVRETNEIVRTVKVQKRIKLM